MLQGFRHHFIQGVGGFGGGDPVPLPRHIFVDRTDAVAKNIYLQFLNGGKALAVSIGLGDLQSGFIGAFIDEIAEGIKAAEISPDV